MAYKPTEILYGKSFDLIPLDMSRVKEMWEYSKDERLYAHFEFDAHKSIEQTRDYLKDLIIRASDKSSHRWFIELKEDRKVIGSFSIHDINYRRDSCEISYAVGPKYWGTGIFSEVTQLVLNYLFEELMFHRVTAVTSSNNHRSIGALKKHGFVIEGRLRDFYKNNLGHRTDALILAKVKSDS